MTTVLAEMVFDLCHSHTEKSVMGASNQDVCFCLCRFFPFDGSVRECFSLLFDSIVIVLDDSMSFRKALAKHAFNPIKHTEPYHIISIFVISVSYSMFLFLFFSSNLYFPLTHNRISILGYAHISGDINADSIRNQ